MFYLFSGLPGSKKTANMIHFVMTDAQFKGRPVFYHRIKECKVSDWTELTLEEVQNWHTVLPAGAVLLIDECQKLWRPSSWDKVPPAHVTELEEHRHKGLDIIATTQHPMLIHTAVRRQVQQHRHYSAEYGLRSKARVWEKCVNDPDDHFNKQDADKISGEVPKSVFNLYKSTELNTHKKRPPKKLYLVAASMVFVGLIGLYLYDRIGGKDEQPVSFAEAEATKEQGTATTSKAKPVSVDDKYSFKPVYPLDKSEYLALYKPRVEGMPHTAPIYDHLQEPVVSPRTFCVRTYKPTPDLQTTCQCFTQQATAIHTTKAMCESYIDFGVFDPTQQPMRQASYTNNGALVKTSQ